MSNILKKSFLTITIISIGLILIPQITTYSASYGVTDYDIDQTEVQFCLQSSYQENENFSQLYNNNQDNRTAYLNNIEEKRLAEERIKRIEEKKIWEQNLRSDRSDCRVNISSESSIQRYLERGLRTETNGGSTIKYKVLSSWNTVGLEIKFDNGKIVKGINVRIKPGYKTASISVDFPSIGGSAVYILYSNGLLESSDGTFKYKCK